MDNVLVLYETDSDFRKEIEKIFTGYRVIFNESKDTSTLDAETAEDIAVIFGNPQTGFLHLCPRLKWLQLDSAGADAYVSGEIRENVLLCCATGAYGHAVSEHMAAMTFSLLKKLHLYRDEQNAGRWLSRGQVKSIKDAVVLVVGLGDIGGEYARCMKAFGSYIIGVRRSVSAKPDFVDELLSSEELEKVLPRADIVALSVPGTKETAGLIGRPQLAIMKKDAIIINVGRGSAIDTEALCDALESLSIGGAALDVTDPEPLPPEHRLWKMENAVITPHTAGGRYMKETGKYIMGLHLENARCFMRGAALKSFVNQKTGYRIPESGL